MGNGKQWFNNSYIWITAIENSTEHFAASLIDIHIARTIWCTGIAAVGEAIWSVTGPAGEFRDAAARILTWRRQADAINQTIHNLKVQRMLPSGPTVPRRARWTG